MARSNADRGGGASWDGTAGGRLHRAAERTATAIEAQFSPATGARGLTSGC